AGQGQPRRSSSQEDEPVERKKSSFVPIIPRGMDARSPYQQRDDLKVLWKGALAGGAIKNVVSKDGKLTETLSRVDVGLPADATRGSFNVNPRQVDAIFKPVAMDKKAYATVRRMQSDLVQSYYRYLYAYHKFALAQQTLSARKQEVEVAGSDSEKQRAAADVAQSQNDADSAKEDLKAAQMELASTAGTNAARSIIGKVSGITPSSESLAVAEPEPPAPAENKGVFGFGSLFGFGGKPAAEQPKEQPREKAVKVAAAPVAKAGKDKKVEGNGKKGAKTAAAAQPEGDLKPAPAPVAASAEPAPQSTSGGISMELKGVNVTARKSVLTVAIRNNSENDFSFDPEAFAVSENNHKLAEAALRADFETTLVQPNQEVKGTITIFGRPWNDRLSVSLSDGSRNVQLRR
ncbi:MAG TPA: hypothetical protein PL012_01760, partial [Candidatus Obscuribacter sp.]|nr:hypothetical protein [Candidatus Obscuribacter sp.]